MIIKRLQFSTMLLVGINAGLCKFLCQILHWALVMLIYITLCPFHHQKKRLDGDKAPPTPTSPTKFTQPLSSPAALYPDLPLPTGTDQPSPSILRSFGLSSSLITIVVFWAGYSTLQRGSRCWSLWCVHLNVDAHLVDTLTDVAGISRAKKDTTTEHFMDPSST